MGADRRAFALIIVLVATAAVFALALQAGVISRASLIETRARIDHSALERQAHDAALLVLVGMTTSAGDAFDDSAFGSSGGATGSSDEPAPDPNDLPPLPPEIEQLLQGLLSDQDPSDQNGSQQASGDSFGQIRVGGALHTLRRTAAVVGPIVVTIADRRFEVRFLDGGGLLNLNRAPENQIVAYLTAKGIAEGQRVAIAQQIIDWRDKDSFVRPRGAERDEHRRRGIVIRNAPMESLAELLLLPDMTREVFDMIEGDVTLFGDGRIHAPSAPREVLLSVESMTPSAADALIGLREAGMLTKETLRDAISAVSRRAYDSFRYEASSLVRLQVRAIDEHLPEFRVDAIVTNSQGIQHFVIRPTGGVS